MGKGAGSGRGAFVGDVPANLTASSLSLQISKIPQNASPKGLENVGNTCYANAALQCLLSTSLSHALLEPETLAIFRRYASNSNLLAAGSGSVDSQDGDEARQMEKLSRRELRRKRRETRKCKEKSEWLTRQLTLITREYASPEPEQHSWFFGSSNTVVNPSSITRHPDRLSKCLRPFQQEDAHEFMRALLSTLTMNGQNRQLSSLFDGLLESAVTCQICGRSSLTRDRYMDLSLDICMDHVNTLGDALCEFTKTEMLDHDNMVMCHTCQQKQPVTKGLRLATAPSILVCHLKRFAFDNYGQTVRLSKHVHFPLKLEIGDYMSRVNKAKPPPYELVGVLVHQGRSCESGHYLAYVKCHNEWYKANDSVVSKADVSTVLSQDAYILLYEVAGMRSSTIQQIEPTHNYHAAPQFDGSRAPEPGRLGSSILNLLCSASETNDAIIRDFCCGVANVMETEAKSQRPKSDPKPHWGPVYEIAVPDSEYRSTRRSMYQPDCDETIGGSTLGDQSSVFTTDSSQISALRRSNSGGNLREVEDAASRIYGNNSYRARTHSFTESDPGAKEAAKSSGQPRPFNPKLPPTGVVRPPRSIHRRRHSSAAPPQKFKTI
jgi:ubiquitin C-terminal hydrolase